MWLALAATGNGPSSCSAVINAGQIPSLTEQHKLNCRAQNHPVFRKAPQWLMTAPHWPEKKGISVCHITAACKWKLLHGYWNTWIGSESNVRTESCPQQIHTLVHLDDSHLSSVFSLCHAALALLLNRDHTDSAWVDSSQFSASPTTGETPLEDPVKRL